MTLHQAVHQAVLQELERSAKDKKLGGNVDDPYSTIIHVYHCIHRSGNQLSSSSYF